MLQEVLSTSALRDHKRQRAQDDRDGKPGCVIIRGSGLRTIVTANQVGLPRVPKELMRQSPTLRSCIF